MEPAVTHRRLASKLMDTQATRLNIPDSVTCASAQTCVCVCVCVWNPVTKGTIMSMQGSQGLVGYLTQRSYASKMDESMDACSCTCRELGMGDAVTACILQHKSRALFPVCKTRFSGSDERSSTCQTCPVANMWWSQLSCTVHGQDTNISLEAR